MQPNQSPNPSPPQDRPVPFTEHAQLLDDEALFALSDALMAQNHDAYRELAK